MRCTDWPKQREATPSASGYFPRPWPGRDPALNRCTRTLWPAQAIREVDKALIRELRRGGTDRASAPIQALLDAALTSQRLLDDPSGDEFAESCGEFHGTMEEAETRCIYFRQRSRHGLSAFSPASSPDHHAASRRFSSKSLLTSLISLRIRSFSSLCGCQEGLGRG
jgi:hypothetical protein